MSAPTYQQLIVVWRRSLALRQTQHAYSRHTTHETRQAAVAAGDALDAAHRAIGDDVPAKSIEPMLFPTTGGR